jgi:hypothetical protein
VTWSEYLLICIISAKSRLIHIVFWYDCFLLLMLVYVMLVWMYIRHMSRFMPSCVSIPMLYIPYPYYLP